MSRNSNGAQDACNNDTVTKMITIINPAMMTIMAMTVMIRWTMMIVITMMIITTMVIVMIDDDDDDDDDDGREMEEEEEEGQYLVKYMIVIFKTMR